MPSPAAQNPTETQVADFDIGALDTPDLISEPEPTPAPRPQPAPKHSAMSLRLAREYGLDPTKYSPEDLDAEVSSISAWLTREYRQRQVEERAPQPRSAQPQPGNVATPAPDDLGLNPANYEPELLDVFNRQQAHIKALEAKLAGLETAHQQRELRTQDDVLDAAFESLGADYERFFGKGAGEELKGSPEMTRRVAIVQAARIDWSKDSPKAVARKVRAAADALYAPALQPPAAGNVATPPSVYGAPPAPQGAGTLPSAHPQPGNVATPTRPRRPDGTFMSDGEIEALAVRQRWNDSALARPTARAGSQEPPGVERAKRAVGEQIRQMSAEGNAPADDLNGFLD